MKWLIAPLVIFGVLFAVLVADYLHVGEDELGQGSVVGAFQG